ncbi:glyoxylate/hydroxypyruvate reductase A [Shimia gijangensis]|uniref:Glyoxylate/hydroxypyruvate reductase A n=1 Tax=Shimia gijangensis TaxID=1470563 RepID=A0A1M6QTF9_9RHOB|nr:NAD(P)-dependent oxidoreductase [Shimia gijangensis]SHK23317.1 glyoxylate/hydroxypyruvate reductase A [Shimia gijangensis]
MALLIDVGISDWMSGQEIAAAVAEFDPGLDIRTRETLGNAKDIRVVAVSNFLPDIPALLPNLELVQKLGAGVETIVDHPQLLDHVRVARLKPEAPAREIAEFCLAYVLREQRNMRLHEAGQRKAEWTSVAPKETLKTTVGVLGLGHIGGYTATLFRDLGYRVLGWSRSQKSLDGIECLCGQDGLLKLLEDCDHVVSILPSTKDTRGLFDDAMFSAMKPGATFVNAGRGDLVDENALVRSLALNKPGHAVLDVLCEEPLPAGSPLWRNSSITITPHVSGWHLGDAFKDVAENYRRLVAGQGLLHEVNRKLGY